MDTFVDSSWYFYRFADAQNDRLPFDPAKVEVLVPGRLLHGRRRARHPAPDLLAVLRAGVPRSRPGRPRRAVHPPAHAGHGAEGRRRDVEVEGQRRRPRHDAAEGRRRRAARSTSCSSRRPRRKWSGATPASTAGSACWRACGAWSTSGATPRWRRRRSTSPALTGAERALRRKTHDTIRRVTADIDARKQMNTAVSAMMELVNELYLFTDAPARRRRRAQGAAVAARGRRGADRAGVAVCAAHGRGTVGDARPRRRAGRGGAGRRSTRRRRRPRRSSCRCRSTARCAAGSPSRPRPRRPSSSGWRSPIPAVQPHLAGKTVRKVVVAQGRLVSVVVG